MNVDVLLKQVKVKENGTNLKSCPGLVIVQNTPSPVPSNQSSATSGAG